MKKNKNLNKSADMETDNMKSRNKRPRTAKMKAIIQMEPLNKLPSSLSSNEESDTSSESNYVLSDLVPIRRSIVEKKESSEELITDQKNIIKENTGMKTAIQSDTEREFRYRKRRVIGEIKTIKDIVADEKIADKEEDIESMGGEEIRKKKLEENSVTEGVPEPAFSCKRVKYPETIESLIENIVQSKRPLQAVLSDDFYKPMTFTKVFIGQVKDVKQLSKIILLLNEKLPLENLKHLKRACRKEVILFPVSTLDNDSHASIQYYIEENINELRDSFEYFKILDVPARAPKIRKQYNECGKSWSCNFHPDKYLEMLYGAELFNEKETEQHRLYMSMAFEVAMYYMRKEKDFLVSNDILSSDLNATVVVDPAINSIVAVAFDNRSQHPIQHSAMIAVDNVAKTQKGGAWGTSDIDNMNLRGIGYMELLLHLKHKYPNIEFGSKAYISKDDLEENDDLIPADSPYLCTGYYVYMIREPCVMCAMGLVHARTKRVFFCFKNSVGALHSLTKLQCMKSLNHRFEVFTDFL